MELSQSAISPGIKTLKRIPILYIHDNSANLQECLGVAPRRSRNDNGFGSVSWDSDSVLDNVLNVSTCPTVKTSSGISVNKVVNTTDSVLFMLPSRCVVLYWLGSFCLFAVSFCFC